MNINACGISSSSTFYSLKSRTKKNVTKSPFIFELAQERKHFPEQAKIYCFDLILCWCEKYCHCIGNLRHLYDPINETFK